MNFYGVGITTEIITAIISLLIFVFIFSFFLHLRGRKGAFKVRTIKPSGDKTKWKKPEADGKTIVMEKGKGKKPGWQFTFTAASVIPGTQKIDVMYGAEEAIEYDFKGKTASQPTLTKQQVKDFANWEALKARYSKMEKYQLPTLFWVILILCGLSVILQFVQLFGIGKFP